MIAFYKNYKKLILFVGYTSKSVMQSWIAAKQHEKYVCVRVSEERKGNRVGWDDVIMEGL